MKFFRLDEISESEKKRILARSTQDIEAAKDYVRGIVSDVKNNGDEAVLRYTKKFDGVDLEKSLLKVSDDEIKQAYKYVTSDFLEAAQRQIKWSRKFAEAQMTRNSWFTELENGVIAGERSTPIECVGLYVPGGTACYPTVMQILATSAKVAGVSRIVSCISPKAKNYEILVAADLAGVDELYRVSGAQAIAAMAYGTETIPRVMKIVGPGNVYVTAAKMMVFGDVSIDMPAGPSEAIIIADDSADVSYVASDMLARAEHDTNSSAVLVTTSEKLAEKIGEEIEKQKSGLSRYAIINSSLEKYGSVILANSLDKAIDFVNEYAPEHLEIITADPLALLPKIRNAGSVFLGRYAPVAVGDYASGTNHVLPTGGNAKAFSPVSVDTFRKKMEFQYLTRDGLCRLRNIVDTISGVEGLDGHRKSVDIRLE